MELSETVKLMNSFDYRERFLAEYLQTKERYERLKMFNNRIEASELVGGEVVHDCPLALLRQQQKCMGEYLHVLEVRALIEHIDLSAGVTHKKNVDKLADVKDAIGDILKDLDEICSDEQELLMIMDEDSPRYNGKELALGCIEDVSELIDEAHEILESLLEE
jgi:hypothetical protein